MIILHTTIIFWGCSLGMAYQDTMNKGMLNRSFVVFQKVANQIIVVQKNQAHGSQDGPL